MTIIEQIKAEIERLKAVQFKRIQEGDLVDAEPYDKNEAYNEILSFLDTLESEKPMNQDGLEQEIIKCWQEWVSPSNKQSVEGVLPLSEFAFFARHFAEWGAEHAMEQMMKEAVEGMVEYDYSTGDTDYLRVLAEISSNQFDVKDGDKVRVIVLPKED